jgi:hypothetical protein
MPLVAAHVSAVTPTKVFVTEKRFVNQLFSISVLLWQLVLNFL